MSDIVINAENLGKRYIIGHQAVRGNYTALRDVLMQNARTLWNKTKDLAAGKPIIQGDTLEEVWALQDLNFAIRRGEAVGIIGRNGAGKSTLLKILSRITEPSVGRLTLKGRVASLLEVGTGFHPELSGRENIYLNGTILGMTRVEIRQKFDEIVAFAEVEKYLDTPVKRYSSGMYVRLAFAVAAHLEPEILVVDEVLAVGDAQFQKKCLGKMEDVGKEGRTVIFVSHNMDAVRALCRRVILLAEGCLFTDAPTEEALSAYKALQFRRLDFGPTTGVGNEKFRRGTGAVRFTKICVEDISGSESYFFSMGDTILFRLSYTVYSPVDHLLASVVLLCSKTHEVITSARHLVSDKPLPPGYEGQVTIEFEKLNLRPKEYPLYLWLGNNKFQPFDVVDDIVTPIIISTQKSEEELGYTLVDVPGYFDVKSRIVNR